MRKVVAKWLLRKAEDELESEKEKLPQQVEWAAELRRRVKDPGWNVRLGGDTGNEESCWAEDARSQAKLVKETRIHIEFLLELVRELRKASR